MMIKKWILLLILAFVLTACGSSGSSPSAPLSQVEGASSSGPTGLSKVEASDGVVLLTPGQGVGTPVPGGAISNPTWFVTVTPTATVDPVSVEMPEGIPLYPGATNLKVPTEEELTFAEMNGLSGNYVIFYTTDNNDQLVEFYSEKAAAAGWSLFSAETEPDYEGIISQLWSKDDKTLMLQTWKPVDGLMKVQVSWF